MRTVWGSIYSLYLLLECLNCLISTAWLGCDSAELADQIRDIPVPGSGRLVAAICEECRSANLPLTFGTSLQ